MSRRLRQFLAANQRPSDTDFVLARAYLSPALFDLFASQHPRDVVHSASTAQWLVERGHTDPDLLAAALLHDIGKGEQRRFDRVAHVLASAGHVAGQVGDSESRFAVRRALARSRRHSESGATVLASAGASERVVYLTRFHHASPPPDPVLALLQQADDAS
jgi:putative nucleotidyltransferase with HDIG domain